MPRSASASASADGTPVKRMRLGTKSCTECRRRKVRCILPPGARKCEGCSLHNVTCQSQQGAPPIAPVTEEEGTNDEEKDALQKRLNHLESMMSRMLEFQNRDNALSTSSPNLSIATPPSAEPTPEGHLNDLTDTTGDAQFEDAPLSGPWKEAMPIAPLPRQHSMISRRPRPSVPFSQPPLLRPCGLIVLVMQSEILRPTWPSCTFDLAGSQGFIAGQGRQNVDIILKAIESNDALLVAKMFLWLTLCLTHFPRSRIKELDLPLPVRELTEHYYKYASSILASVEDAADSIDGFECIVLQWRLNADNGKPRKAWQNLRQAITSAIQLGLHRLTTDGDKRKLGLWHTIWQNERQLACMLGLPCSTSTDHPGTQLSDLPSEDPLAIAHLKMSIVAGEIIKRDHTDLKNNYALTVQLDQDLEDILPLLPDPRAHMQADVPFAVRYAQMGIVVRFWFVHKLLHMPYMLKSVKESRYEYSFNRAMEASRNIIDTFMPFRQHCSDFLCETLDFNVFSAAIILLLGMISRQNAGKDDGSEEDWQRIVSTSKVLRSTATAIGCSVATQGADTLDVLLAARNGTYAPQEDFVATIPYFGRVNLKYAYAPPAPTSIAMSNAVPAPSLSNTSSSLYSTEGQFLYDNSTQMAPQQPPPFFSIEFSSNEFNPVVPMDFSFGGELTEDWFQGYGDQLPDYDWMQEYPYYTASSLMQM